MRVITGKYKGRKLVAPQGETRPTLDRTKETLFNILNLYIKDAVVLDLFAGSGQIAIEFLSRYAKRVVLCDNDKFAVKAITENFNKIGEKPELYVCGYEDCLKRQNCKFDLIFVDPPYRSGYYESVLTAIENNGLLFEDGIVVCEHSADEDLPISVGGLSAYDCRKIGTVKFTFYRRSL